MIFFRKNDETRQDAEPGPQGLAERARAAELPPAAREAVDAELGRLSTTDPSAAEYAISTNYVELLLSLPWNAVTPDSLDLERAEAVLDASHAGLGQIKDRILEHLASRTMRQKSEAWILVVDDEPIARENLRHVLVREGYRVETAENGQAALERVRRFEFDLIVTDLKMDRMDGLQLLDKAKAVSPATKIMIVTGFATVDTAVRAIKTGAVHYLTKPIDLDEFRSSVRGILAQRPAETASRSPILCFVGPPGVGKTSVGMAIAQAMGRTFTRMSLADLRDDAELRGHRRTYVGALPGRVISALRGLSVRNPVFMLDEVDKIGRDVKGDPAQALLEILDPEQNCRFVDRYMEVPFDLSGVFFIATANSTERLAGPVLDRMEVVPFSGYSEEEKIEIATRFLAPRQLREHGLTHPYPDFTRQALQDIIRGYTNEAGVRGLEREIARVCRKIARVCLSEGKTGFAGDIAPDMAAALLGPRRFSHETAGHGPQVGEAVGLVWSETGGEIVSVEVSRMRGASRLLLTGSLGEVLKESGQIALSHLRSNAVDFGIDPGFFAEHDIHIHIPAGGVSKDGPSAGLTMAVALFSLLSGRPTPPGMAFSGEISLSGRVLRVAGVREKLLAAVRAGITSVVLPMENAAEVEEAGRSMAALPRIVLVSEVRQALAAAFDAPAGQTLPEVKP
ncbi:S16 family serine protease [Desulfolutivibrio sp.]|uniref:S16 family serine protease n=1 Tax=Desulfolutivibrio sp. TaxID=2773296 RepID=UPI002F9678CE